MPEIARRIGFVALCLILPVVWGVAVNYAFDLWQKKRQAVHEAEDEAVFPDYQI